MAPQLLPNKNTEALPLNAPADISVKTDTETFNELKTAKLADIKAKLSATDYKRMKFADGDLTAEEYEPIKVERHNLRSAYNAIEAATTIEEINNI